MAVFDFPNTPAVGDLFTDPTSGAAYKWNGYAWMGGSGGSLGALVVQDAPPTSPADNSLWYESDTGMLFLRYNDGNSSQWVQLNALPSGAGYATIPYVNAQTYGANRLLNGNMRIDQRNGGASSTANGYTADRWRFVGVANKGTWQRRNAGPALLALGYSCFWDFTSSSSYTPAAGDVEIIYQAIEADMVTDFAWGTSSAQPVTLSFWAYSSLTGTFGGVLKNTVPDRSYPFTYSLPNASTWTKIAITIPGDTGGTWALAGNGFAVLVQFDLGCGSTYRGPAGAWAAGNWCGANGTVSVVSTNAAVLDITAVKLEIGTLATPFQMESVAKQLTDCQRYYQVIQGTICVILANGSYSGTVHSVNFPVPMRATPTVALPTVTPGGGFVGTLISSAPNFRNCNFVSSSPQTGTSAYVSYTATLDADF